MVKAEAPVEVSRLAAAAMERVMEATEMAAVATARAAVATARAVAATARAVAATESEVMGRVKLDTGTVAVGLAAVVMGPAARLWAVTAVMAGEKTVATVALARGSMHRPRIRGPRGSTTACSMRRRPTPPCSCSSC